MARTYDFFNHIKVFLPVLENILIQLESPKKQVGAFQKSFSICGSLDPEIHPSHQRPFVFVLTSPLMPTNKNSNVIKWYGFSKTVQDLNNRGAGESSILSYLTARLQEENFIGKNRNLGLKLCFYTTRSNAMLKYPIVGSVSYSGFTSKSNPAYKMRSTKSRSTRKSSDIKTDEISNDSTTL